MMNNTMMKKMAVLMMAAVMTVPAAASAEEAIPAAETAYEEAFEAGAFEGAFGADEFEEEDEEILVADEEILTGTLEEIIIDGSDHEEEFEIPELVEYIDTEEIIREDEIRTSFVFENDEVVIAAEVSEAYSLPADAEMNAEKLAEGTDAFTAAKIATVNSLGTDEAARYSFYDVNFTVNGETVELEDVQLTVNFKNAAVSVFVKDGIPMAI